jgi:hypothetical protein
MLVTSGNNFYTRRGNDCTYQRPDDLRGRQIGV